MPKIKSHKGTAKRIRVSGGKQRKFVRRKATQSHFNAREDGSTVRLKRKDSEVSETSVKKLKVLLPYSLKKANNKTS